MKPSVLLIAFQFCPKGGVGTRRWSKFAKYIVKDESSLHVLTINYPYKDSMNWCHDVKDKNIIIHRTNSMYPNFLFRTRRSLFIKMIDRVLNSTIYFLDYAQYWRLTAISKAISIIKTNNIKNVIVTGAPFSSFYLGHKIKRKIPHIKLFLDYRDPWNISPSFIKKNRLFKKISLNREIKALKSADKVFFTTNDLKNKYSLFQTKFKSKYSVIYNGYDIDDKGEETQENYDYKEFNIVYAGNLSFGRTKAFELIVQALIELDDEFLKDRLRINVFNDQIDLNHFGSKLEFNEFKRYFRFNGKVTPHEVFQLYKEHFCCLSINAEVFPYLVGAKLFDYMLFGNNIWHISNGGEFYNILKDKGMYCSFYTIEEIKYQLLNLKKAFLKRKSTELIFNEFEYNLLTEKLLNEIN